MKTINNILRIDASARLDGSVTRDLATKTIDHLASQTPVKVVTRDLTQTLPFIDGAWVGANFTPAEQRTEDQKAKLSLSDSLVEEIKTADTLVIGLPVYNFGIPAALKAWIDLIARARLTFRYTENGPEGLLTDKRAIVLVASGGTPMGSHVDFATPYLRQVLNFIGITDITFIAADGLGADAHKKINEATQAIAAL